MTIHEILDKNGNVYWNNREMDIEMQMNKKLYQNIKTPIIKNVIKIIKVYKKYHIIELSLNYVIFRKECLYNLRFSNIH